MAKGKGKSSRKSPPSSAVMMTPSAGMKKMAGIRKPKKKS